MRTPGRDGFALLAAGMILGTGLVAGLGAWRGAPPTGGTTGWEYALLSCRQEKAQDLRPPVWSFTSPTEDFGPAGVEEFSRLLGRPEPKVSAEFEFVNNVAARGWELVTHSRDSAVRSISLSIHDGNAFGAEHQVNGAVSQQWWFRRVRPAP